MRSVLVACAKTIGIEHFAAHGGDLNQIKQILGHGSIVTTYRYLGSGQEIAVAVNDNLGI